MRYDHCVIYSCHMQIWVMLMKPCSVGAESERLDWIEHGHKPWLQLGVDKSSEPLGKHQQQLCQTKGESDLTNFRHSQA